MLLNAFENLSPVAYSIQNSSSTMLPSIRYFSGLQCVGKVEKKLPTVFC